MRTVINISLPEELADEVAAAVQKGKFASTSEYFRHLVRAHRSAEELGALRKDFERGKGKPLKSLASLR